jgi:flagellar hook-associated protein 2
LILPIINYIIVFEKEKLVGISSPGIGSNLDVNSIVSKLLAVESRPLNVLAQKESTFQAKLGGLGILNGAVSTLQGSLSGLSNQSTFQSISATPADSSVLTTSATNQAAAGLFNVNVTQLAQSQTIATAGLTSTTAAIGLGASTTLSFQFGTVSGGSFGFAGSNLSASVAANGIADGSLSINGTAISTGSNTNSAKELAAAINAKASTTGVSATAAPTLTSATLFSNFGDTDVGGDGTFTLAVGGVTIASQIAGGAPVSAASIDATLASDAATQAALAAAGITFTGTATDGTLQFSKTDGANLAVTEVVTGTGPITGGIGKAALEVNTGSTTTTTSSVTISSTNASPITVGGNNPTNAGLVAGTGGSYIGATYTQDGNASSGSVVIDGTNNSLQGIRDAINKANIGITATIVSDGSASPNRLVFTSTKSGSNSSFRISVGGAAPDAAISNLLTYDPAGTQNLTQSTAAQSTKLTVNGIAVSGTSNTITGAIQGVTLNVAKLGSTNITVARDTGAVKNGINGFVKAYNEFNTSLKSLTSFDPDTKRAGVLLGDSTTQRIQSEIRNQLSKAITGLSGNLTNLGQIGISFQKDGSLLLDSAKLQTAITNNFDDIGALFTSVGKTSDSLVKFTSSTAATKPGTFGINLTQLASQGTILGTVDLTQQPVTIAADTSFSVTLNGTTPVTSSAIATVNIAAGSYTATEFAAALQSAINSVPSFSGLGSSASASINDSGFLEVKSTKFGSVSNISLTSLTGTPVSAFLGDAPSNVDGTDVAGIIGDTEATGSGQFLTGKSGTSSEGVKIEITGGGLGDRGNVIFTQGYAGQLSALASTFIGTKGFITNATEGLNSSVKDIGKSRDAFNAKLGDVEKRLRAQFTALDVTIGRLNTTSAFLTQQLAALSKQSSS